jgi:U3 small nucleolar RNA-associated protein 15
MAAQVQPVALIKHATSPSTVTPEQKYWLSFKSPSLVPSPSNNPVTYISAPDAPLNASTTPSDPFAVTTGTRVQIFSIRTRKLVKSISRFSDVARGAEIRRDGRVLVAGDDSGAIQVFDVGSRAILKTWKEHKQSVWATKFSPTDTTTLMSASDDRTVRLWDLPSQESTLTMTGHADYIRCGAFMPGQASGLVVSGSYDQTVKLWDPRAGSAAIMTFKFSAPVETVLPMPLGTTVLAAADNRIAVLDIVGGKPLQMLQNHQKTVTAMSLASQGSRLVSGSLDGHIKVYETTGWNVVHGAKYPSPILSLSVITSGAGREDRHLAVGMQSGLLSIKTRLSGQQKVKERERQKEMQALLEGKIEEHDKKRKKDISSSVQRRLRGTDFMGEGADVIIQANAGTSKKKLKVWEKMLHRGRYATALDQVLEMNDVTTTATLLTALRHRSALRTALSGRDEITIQPILQWIKKYIIDPRFVNLCVETGITILDLYSNIMGQSSQIDSLMAKLHDQVRREVDRAQQAHQTEGMLSLLLGP